MLSGICEAIKSVFNSITQCSKTIETSILEKTTTCVVKDKESLQKAVNYAEELIEITDQYKNCYSEDDLKEYDKLRHKFFKYN